MQQHESSPAVLIRSICERKKRSAPRMHEIRLCKRLLLLHDYEHRSQRFDERIRVGLAAFAASTSRCTTRSRTPKPSLGPCASACGVMGREFRRECAHGTRSRERFSWVWGDRCNEARFCPCRDTEKKTPTGFLRSGKHQRRSFWCAGSIPQYCFQPITRLAGGRFAESCLRPNLSTNSVDNYVCSSRVAGSRRPTEADREEVAQFFGIKKDA